MENPTARHKLRQKLCSIRQVSASGRSFFSYNDLKFNVTQTMISGVIAEIDIPEHRRSVVTAKILKDGLIVFSILSWLHHEEKISYFIETDELDTKLPMEQAQISRIATEMPERFCKEVQWEFLPHMFKRDDYHRKLRPEVILPFLSEERLAEGAGGEIFKCNIAVAQQELLPIQKELVVVLIRKRIKLIKHKEEKERAFKREAECLEILRNLRHKNIIELLASYEHNNEHYLLFPLFSMDLAEFLERNQRYGEFENDLTFYNALSGLASAVETIHNVSYESEDILLTRIGYHHDIRPKNVLVTPTTFVLTDFGLARLKLPDEDSQTGWKGGIGDYIAPECMDEEWNHQKVGRSIDIWSFGCLVADVATFMELGCSGIKRFHTERGKSRLRKRIEDSYFFEGHSLKKSVSDWLTTLSIKPKDRGVRCLVEAARQMLQVDHKMRPEVTLVSRRFAYINIKVVYRAVADFIQRVSEAKTLHDSEVSPYRRLNIWFEFEKFKAWGTVVGMNTDQTSHPLFEKDMTRSRILCGILENVRVKLQAYSATDNNVDRSAHEGRNIHGILDIMPVKTSLDENLRILVQELWQNVPREYQKRMEQAWRQSSLDTDSVEALTEIEEGAHVLSAPFSEIGVYAALKRLELEFWRHGEKAGPEQKKLLLRASQIERQSSLSMHHEIGFYQPTPRMSAPRSIAVSTRQPVLIEWVLYSPIWEGQSDEEKIVKLLSLAEILHHPKPEGFHILNCVGVVPPTEELHHQGFGFVYSYPDGIDANQGQEPQTLLSLLKKKSSPVPLEDKFRIAKCLSSSVSQLHSKEWLHKNIQSSNILLFHNASQDSLMLGEPYLIGFQHSRPDGEIWYSGTDLYHDGATEYRDPQYLPGTTRFQKVHDYYSLGIVLLEVGFWEPIALFKQRHSIESKDVFRETLIEKYAPKLAAKMGSLYKDIVIACLTGKFDRNQTEGNIGDVDADFYWTVVAKLSELKIS